MSDSHKEEIDANFSFLKNYTKDITIYGVNTGFGPMAQYIIPDDDLLQLQKNLIRSHASGTGDLLKPRYARAVILARLISLSRGYSGIHPSALTLLTEMLNHDISPAIFEHGGVGASGDLVQLAHLALGMLGEGDVFEKGKKTTASQALSNNNITPLAIHMREGLALINGTSAMTGIGLINLINAKNLLQWTTIIAAMLNEITESYDDHYAEVLNNAKKHHAQSSIADDLRNILADSKLTKTRTRENQQIGSKAELEKKMQEYYSIRCVPQILGPVKEAIEQCENVLIAELNSANDNPIVDHKTETVYHGGNFHGDYVSFEMDKLKIAITKLTMLVERQINYLMNSKINEKLPPFLNLQKLGLNFGMQGVQFTATSTTAESQMLSNPMYVHSISTNNDNQDIVSMGTNSALITKKVIENAYQVVSIGLMATTQAIDVLKVKDKMSAITNKQYENIRVVAETIDEDKPRYEDINNVKEYLYSTLSKSIF